MARVTPGRASTGHCACLTAQARPGPAQKARGTIVLRAGPWPAIWKTPNLIQNLTKHKSITFKSQTLILHNSHNTIYSQIIFHLPKVKSLTRHRTWYFKFYKFPNTGPTPYLLLKVGRAMPPDRPRGRPNATCFGPARARLGSGHAVLGPGQITVL